APVRRGGWLLMQRRVDDARLHLGRHARRASRTRSVSQQRLYAALAKAPSPERHLPPIKLHLSSDLLVLPALGGQQDCARTLLHSRLHTPAFGQDAQLTFDLPTQFDLLGNSHRSTLPPPSSMQLQISSVNYGALH